jgi:hypothetical protein
LLPMCSVPVDETTLAAEGAVMVVTDHSARDYDLVARCASVVNDSRGVCPTHAPRAHEHPEERGRCARRRGSAASGSPVVSVGRAQHSLEWHNRMHGTRGTREVVSRLYFEGMH